MLLHIKKYFFLILWLTCCISIWAQKENNIWYFGRGAGLDFNFSPPKAITSNKINTGEGCSSVADENGQLLFYTDGTTVWNKNHEIMNNGSGLKGNSSSTQSSIVVKKPISSSLYYLFNAGINSINKPSGLHYSVIDMSLDSGKGKVITKNVVLLNDSASEKIAILKADSKCGYWVVAHGEKNNKFYSYFLDENGLNHTPVVSAVGHDYSLSKATVGYLKASPNGTKLAAVLYFSEGIELYDFDKVLGVVSNPRIIDSTSGRYYGCVFSPNGKYLYIGTINSPFSIFQFNVSYSTTADIIASKRTIATNMPAAVGAFQEGPNGKLYLAFNGRSFLGVINNPNAPANAVNFEKEGVKLTGKSVWGLPSFINDNGFMFSKEINLGNDTLICSNEYLLNSGLSNIAKFIWSNGDSTPSTKVVKSGLYWVKASNKCWGDAYDSINIAIMPDTLQKVMLGNDTSVCTSYYPLASNITQNLKHLWSTGDTTKNISVTKSGNYRLTVSNMCYENSDSINITFIKDTVNTIDLGVDTLICGDEYVLKSGLSGTTKFIWSNGDLTANTKVVESGLYWVKASNQCWSDAYDSIDITIIPDTLQRVVLGNDTTVCGVSLLLTSNITQNLKYLWSTGDTTKNISVTKNGNYRLTVSNICYENSDSINITFIKDTISEIDLGVDTLTCEKELILFAPNILGAVYKWSTGDTTFTTAVNNSGIYYVNLFTPICNNTYTDSIEVDFYTSKPIQLAKDMVICEKSFEAFTLEINKDYKSYLWSTGSRLPNTEITREGNYTISTLDTCNVSFTKSIVVNVCHCELYVPNTFTPNNDGNNDVFKITNDCGFAKYDLKIFNRWGSLIFQTQNVNAVWDGTYKGEPAPEGVYLVSLRYNHMGDLRSPDYNHTLTLLR